MVEDLHVLGVRPVDGSGQPADCDSLFCSAGLGAHASFSQHRQGRVSLRPSRSD